MPVFFCSRKDIQAGDKRNKNKHLTRLFYAWPAVEQRQSMHSWTSRLPAVSLPSMEAASNIQKPRVKSGVSTAATVCTFHVVFLIFDYFFFFHTSSIPGELRCNGAICQLHGWRKMKTGRR